MSLYPDLTELYINDTRMCFQLLKLSILLIEMVLLFVRSNSLFCALRKPSHCLSRVVGVRFYRPLDSWRDKAAEGNNNNMVFFVLFLMYCFESPVKFCMLSFLPFCGAGKNNGT